MYKNFQDRAEKDYPQNSTSVAEVNEYTCHMAALIESDSDDDLTFSMVRFDDKDPDETEQQNPTSVKCIAQLLSRLIGKQSPPETKLDPPKPDPPEPELPKPELPKPEPSKPEPSEPEPSKPEPPNPGFDGIPSNVVSLPSHKHDIVKGALDKLDRIILLADGHKELEALLKEMSLALINMVDTGGQPIFQHLLPSLTVGQALYLVFFPLHKPLNSVQPVEFWSNGRKTGFAKDDTYCPEDVIFQTLSSIDCYGRCMPNWSKKVKEEECKKLLESRALIIGTYLDMLKPTECQTVDDKLSEINDLLKRKLKNTTFLKCTKSVLNIESDVLDNETDLLVRSGGKYFFQLDNDRGDGKDLLTIKRKLKHLIKTHFKLQPIPASWLMFRMVLHLMEKPVIPQSEVDEIGRHYKMQSEEVQGVIAFYQEVIGNLMYYSKDDVPSLNGGIICKPQIVFDCITEWIIDPLIHNDETPDEKKDLLQDQGEFYSSGIIGRNKEGFNGQQLLEILEYVGVISQISPSSENTESDSGTNSTDTTVALMAPSALNSETTSEKGTSLPVKKYILPAMLPYVSNIKQLPYPINSIKMPSCPIMVCFDNIFGYVPFGIFCSLVLQLVRKFQHKKSPTIIEEWKLRENISKERRERNRNRFIFVVGGAFDVILTSHFQYLQIQVCQLEGTNSTLSLPEVCLFVQENITAILKAAIIESIQKKYSELNPGSVSKAKRLFNLAFECTCKKQLEPHLMIIEDLKSKGSTKAKCSHDQSVPRDLDRSHLDWIVSKLLCACVKGWGVGLGEWEALI